MATKLQKDYPAAFWGLLALVAVVIIGGIWSQSALSSANNKRMAAEKSKASVETALKKAEAEKTAAVAAKTKAETAMRKAVAEKNAAAAAAAKAQATRK